MCDYRGGDRRLVVPLVFKTSEGLARVLGGFDSHSPPPFFPPAVEFEREKEISLLSWHD
jgi:hypothetical protein